MRLAGPRWFAALSYVLTLAVAEMRAVSLVFPLWIGVVSILIVVRRQRLLA